MAGTAVVSREVERKMVKKSSNTAMRVLMGAGSVIGFVGGWMILGQAGNQSAVEVGQATVPVVSAVTTTGGNLSTTTGQGTTGNTNSNAASVQPTATSRSVTQIPTPALSQGAATAPTTTAPSTTNLP